MTLGTAIGVAALVAASGFGSSARAEVQQRFLALQSTEVIVTDTQPVPGQLTYPLNAPQALFGSPDVQAAGILFSVGTSVSSGVRTTAESVESSTSVVASTPGLLPAASAAFTWGQGLSAWMLAARADVVVLGKYAANALHVFTPGEAVLIDGIPFTVVGVLARIQAEPELLGDAIIPATTALHLWGVPSRGIETVIKTAVGASTEVANEAPVALLPTDPSRLAAVGETSSPGLASVVNNDVGQLATIIGIVTMVIGAFAIAIAMILTVVERIYEIGLRRALGATRFEITLQFLIESVVIGVLGGLVGTALGVITLVMVADGRDWPAVVAPLVLVLAPLGGGLAGLIAGLYPAARAARLLPVDALRRF